MLSSDPSIFGLSGSPTWVEDIRLVEPNRKGIVLSELTPKEAAIQISKGSIYFACITFSVEVYLAQYGVWSWMWNTLGL